MKTNARINWGILNNYLEGDLSDDSKPITITRPKKPIPARSSALAMATDLTLATKAALAISSKSTSAPAPVPAVPKSEDLPPRTALYHAIALFMSAWEWIRARQGARCHTKRLEVATSVSLGEKRFVAVIQIDGKQFLVGGGATNVALLAQLNSNETFSNLLNDKMAKPLVEPKKRPVKKSAEMELGRAGAQA